MLDELARGLAALPVLVLATAEDAGALADLHADAVVRLGPLDLSGVATVARLYAREGAEVPVEQLAEASGGVPQRVHRAAAQWARADAARRLSVTAARAASERSGLRATEDDLAGDMVELQAVHERSEARDRDAGVVACPFKGLASFDVEDADMFFGRERLGGQDGGAPGGRTAHGGGRPVGQRQVLSAARRPARGAARWRAPRQRGLAAGPPAPGGASAARARAGDGRYLPGEPDDPRGRSVRGGLHRLSRRARTQRVRRRARRPRARSTPPRACARCHPRRLLRPLCGLRRAVDVARRQPRARRPDAPRRAAPRDRAPGAARGPPRRARSRRCPDRRRQGRTRSAAAAVNDAAGAVGAA